MRISPDKKSGKRVIFFFRDDRQMSTTENYEQLIRMVASLGRNDVVQKIKSFNGRFRLDFTDEYLKGLSLDRLKHILFAALSTKFKKPN
ncbi:MAG: hypothetical protein A2173_11760 [Planctomycetes bacterium RBG_13_44_8b]|nr:MAG: hypothetical protein A2173_11760 [Planctomycetes bacterium RBG_13_44_8b]